jgi:hypothetical protein
VGPDGHQTHILTSRFDLPAGEIAARMFNRWRQENYFRYARAHFALDALDSYTTVDDDPKRSVPNPAKRAAQRQVRRLEQVVADAQATLGRHRNTPQLAGTLDELDTTLDEVRRQLDAARQAAADTPARLPLAQIAPHARLLDSEPKLLTHACRIAAYNAESALARLAAPHYARANDEARSLIAKHSPAPVTSTSPTTRSTSRSTPSPPHGAPAHSPPSRAAQRHPQRLPRHRPRPVLHRQTPPRRCMNFLTAPRALDSRPSTSCGRTCSCAARVTGCCYPSLASSRKGEKGATRPIRLVAPSFPLDRHADVDQGRVRSGSIGHTIWLPRWTDTVHRTTTSTCAGPLASTPRSSPA